MKALKFLVIFYLLLMHLEYPNAINWQLITLLFSVGFIVLWMSSVRFLENVILFGEQKLKSLVCWSPFGELK